VAAKLRTIPFSTTTAVLALCQVLTCGLGGGIRRAVGEYRSTEAYTDTCPRAGGWQASPGPCMLVFGRFSLAGQTRKWLAFG
jgi:hypothetical protein